jgi:hypothetical protein
MAICKIPISNLPKSGGLDGSELIPVVEGSLTKQSALSELSGFVDLQYVTEAGNTTTQNISTNATITTNVLSATEIHSVSSFTTVTDIKQFELSGFTATGDLLVSGDIKASERSVSDSLVSNNINIDHNTLFIQASTNKVGINTSNPISGLDVNEGGLKVTGDTLLSAGHVGIDVIDPDEKLEVDGNIKISAERFYRMAGDAFQIGIDGCHHGMHFHAGGSEKLTLLSGGNVGIAVTDPDQKLEVDGNIKISAERFYQMAGNDFQIGIDGAHQCMQFHAGGGEKITLLSGGNVGIGTTSPDTLLEIVGADPILTIRDSEVDNSNTSSILRLAESGDSDTLHHYRDLKFGGDGKFSIGFNNSGDTDAEQLVILCSGNVGIAVTDPDEKLEVDGNIKIANDRFYRMGGDAFQIGADGGAVGMHIHAGGSEKVTLLAGGNLGIGITNPNKTLTVSGDISGNSRVIIGCNNIATGDASSIVGSLSSSASGDESVVIGGASNTVSGQQSIVAGGFNNLGSAQRANIIGGHSNIASTIDANIIGGFQTRATGTRSTAIGGYQLSATNESTFTAGGLRNIASGDQSAVVGGEDNEASGGESFAGSGKCNVASACMSFVGGGLKNTASGLNSTVIGGLSSTASNAYASVIGGQTNKASGQGSFIGGGINNTAKANSSFILGSNINAHVADTAYVNNLSATDNIDVGGDLAVDTNTLFVDATNNRVGIGTLSPNQTLTVAGEVSASGTTKIGRNLAGLPVFTVDVPDNRVGINKCDPAATLHIVNEAAAGGAGSNKEALRVVGQTLLTTIGDTNLVIQGDSNNVGNDDEPLIKLRRGTLSANEGLVGIVGSSNNALNKFVGALPEAVYIQAQNNEAQGLSAENIQFAVNEKVGLTIKGSESKDVKVGIGTEAPTEKLHVAERGQSAFILLSSYPESKTQGIRFGGNIIHKNHDVTDVIGELNFEDSSNANSKTLVAQIVSRGIGASLTGQEVNSDAGGNIVFSTKPLSGTLSEVLKITEAGNLSGTGQGDFAALNTTGGVVVGSTIDTSGQIRISKSGDANIKFCSDDTIFYTVGTHTNGFKIRDGSSGQDRIDIPYPFTDDSAIVLKNNTNINGIANISNDLIVDTKVLHVDASKNSVGINTLSADEALTVAGNISASGSLSAGRIQISDTKLKNFDSGSSSLTFEGGNDSRGAAIKLHGSTHTSYPSGALIFSDKVQFFDTAATTNFITISSKAGTIDFGERASNDILIKAESDSNDLTLIRGASFGDGVGVDLKYLGSGGGDENIFEIATDGGGSFKMDQSGDVGINTAPIDGINLTTKSLSSLSLSAGQLIGGLDSGANGSQSFIGGGCENTASGDTAVVAGGLCNVASNTRAFVGAGSQNIASGNISGVVGGNCNNATGFGSFVGGGKNNEAKGGCSTVTGGFSSRADGSGSVVAGGFCNETTNSYSIIGGGLENKTIGSYAVLGGGQKNRAGATASFVGGGLHNRVCQSYSTLVGGLSNVVDTTYGIVGGGFSNEVHAVRSGILGGTNNIVNHQDSFAIGSNLRSNGDCTTVVNNLSSQGSLHAGDGFSGNIAGCSTITVVNGIITAAS